MPTTVPTAASVQAPSTCATPNPATAMSSVSTATPPATCATVSSSCVVTHVNVPAQSTVPTAASVQATATCVTPNPTTAMSSVSTATPPATTVSSSCVVTHVNVPAQSTVPTAASVQATSTCVTPSPSTAVSSVACLSLTNPSTSDLTGSNVGYGITEWYFPDHVSQSTLDGRNGSNAGVFLTFGMLYKLSNLPLSGQNLSVEWQKNLVTAIRIGNDMHDELYDQQGVDVTVEDAITEVGQHCQVLGISQENDMFGADPLKQFETVVQSLLQQKSSFHILVANKMAVLIIVDCYGNLILVYLHKHVQRGAIIDRSVQHVGQQAHWFAVWFNQMLRQSYGNGLSIYKVSTVVYL